MPARQAGRSKTGLAGSFATWDRLPGEGRSASNVDESEELALTNATGRRRSMLLGEEVLAKLLLLPMPVW